MQNNLVVISVADLEALIAKVIDSRLTAPTNAIEKHDAEIIDTEELCKRLNITGPTVRKWRAKKKIPFIKVGDSIRFDFQDVLKALKK